MVNFSNPVINNDVNTVVHPGGTVNFVEVSDDDPVFTGYCGAVRISYTKLLLTYTYLVHSQVHSTPQYPN